MRDNQIVDLSNYTEVELVTALMKKGMDIKEIDYMYYVLGEMHNGRIDCYERDHGIDSEAGLHGKASNEPVEQTDVA